jgi:DNA-binding NarL/FixJ family response regulator
VTIPLKTRIVLADDHAVVRRGLRLVLDREPDLEVVAEASDGDEAVAAVLEHRPELAVLDITMPHKNGLQAARDIAERAQETRCLMLSMHDNERFFFEALRAGVAGYVLKSSADQDLVEACRAAMRGEAIVYPSAVKALVRDYLDRVARGDEDADELLSDRELEVVTLIAEGNTSREIAARLVISEKTVERHRANVLQKLGLRNRVDLTRYAIRRGLIEP